MTTRAIELDTILLLAVSAAAGIVFAVSTSHKPSIHYPLPGAQKYQNPISLLAPVPPVKTFSQVSPDGTATLKITATTNKDTTVTYEVIASGTVDKSQRSIYSITLPAADSLSIPFNAWSPDNKRVFILKNRAGGNEAIVINASGLPLVEGEQYLNVATLFAAKKTEYTYQETTGWASETLLIVNTTRQDGSKGPSYWVEIPSKAVIQLSTAF
ncbi:MAG TPA: hypothetical protein VKC89_02870 [Patescibacteria group bacterium]|nr:hypothetical protein [Patescibacteria group bacterium]